MSEPLQSLQTEKGEESRLRRRLTWRGELLLALLPTAVVLLVLGVVKALSRQQLLFASLASSAFLIYLDPRHGANKIRTLVLSQMLAAGLGFGAFLIFGREHPYLSSGGAMVLTIVLMIVLDAVHPPAVSTSLSFALRAGDAGNVTIFGLAVGVTAILVVLQRSAIWLLARYNS